MKRLFTGIEIPDKQRAVLEKLRGGLPGARWVDKQAFHITLSFIGKTSNSDMDEIIAALDKVEAGPFTVTLAGLGNFGSRRVRAIWAGVEENPQLVQLQSRQSSALQRLGIDLEKRKFKPHVTLARFKKGDRKAIGRFIERKNLFKAPEFEVTRFVLFSSRPSGGGGPYGVEAAFSFKS